MTLIAIRHSGLRRPHVSLRHAQVRKALVVGEEVQSAALGTSVRGKPQSPRSHAFVQQPRRRMSRSTTDANVAPRGAINGRIDVPKIESLSIYAGTGSQETVRKPEGIGDEEQGGLCASPEQQ